MRALPSLPPCLLLHPFPSHSSVHLLVHLLLVLLLLLLLLLLLVVLRVRVELL
jgi:hypothetical protein